jgi:hypothetical protein
LLLLLGGAALLAGGRELEAAGWGADAARVGPNWGRLATTLADCNGLLLLYLGSVEWVAAGAGMTLLVLGGALLWNLGLFLEELGWGGGGEHGCKLALAAGVLLLALGAVEWVAPGLATGWLLRSIAGVLVLGLALSASVCGREAWAKELTRTLAFFGGSLLPVLGAVERMAPGLAASCMLAGGAALLALGCGLGVSRGNAA